MAAFNGEGGGLAMGPMVVMIPLGVYYNGHYETFPHCASYLEVLITRINCDDKKTHYFRRCLAFRDIITADLKPMLISCNDQPRIFRLVVKLLAGLTIPIECLTFEKHPLINFTIISFELIGWLSNVKNTFLDPTATKVLIDYIKLQHENNKLSSISSSMEEKECVGFILQILRNILSAKERTPESNENQQMTASSSQRCNTQQNQLICNLFSQGFDQLLLDMLASYPQKNEWVTTIAQIIEFLFEDQSVEKIQNRFVRDSEFSDIDDESSMSSHEINTCESEENMASSLSCSSSSRKRNLMGQRKTEYLLTNDDIFELLKRFIAELFMQNGFNTLVGNLYQQSLRNEDVKLNKDHQNLLWIIENFMVYFSILKIEAKNIKDALNIEILSYLTFEAVREAEKLEKLMESRDLNLSLPRQLPSCVNAIREYLRVLVMNSSVGGGSRSLVDGIEESKGLEEWSNQLCVKLLDMQDLHKLFLLLLRQFSNNSSKKIPNADYRSFLCDILETNHLLLHILKWAAEKFPMADVLKNFDFQKHLKQFCSENILYQYGSVLQEFRTNENRPGLNECILTFLFRYLYDLGRTDLLYHPLIIRPISEIWEEKPEILDNWSERVRRIYKFERNCHHGRRCNDRAKSKLGSISGISELSDQEISQVMQCMSIYQFDDLATNTTVPIKEDIKSIISQLTRSGFHEQINWIQSSLLTTCSVKMGTYDGKEFCQPVACMSVRQNIPCPIVPWTEREVYALSSAQFVSLLHDLGLILASDLYPCIPSEWSAKILYDVAFLLGHIDPHKLDFDQSRLYTKPDEGISCDPIFDRSKGKFVDESRSHIWGLVTETESSKSLLLGDPNSRVLQWVEQQSTNRVCLSLDEREEPDVSALDQHRSTDEDGPFLESLSMEEMPFDEEMT